MEIQINNTPGENDDLVQLNCSHPRHAHIVKCRIHAKNPSAIDSIVVLTNGEPDGKLLFPSDATTTVVVPRDPKSWAQFEISGNKPSTSIGDAVIEAHCDSENGRLLATKKVTVFSFNARLVLASKARLERTKPGQLPVKHGYILKKDVVRIGPKKYEWLYTFDPEDEGAVDFSATAAINPRGLNCEAPQIRDLRIGIMQDTQARGQGSFQSVNTWMGPRVNYWNEAIPVGRQIWIPTRMTKTITFAPWVQDWIHDGSGKGPLYLGPDDPHYKESIQLPTNCGGKAAKSNDTPDHRAESTCTCLVPDPVSGIWAASVTWGKKDDSQYITMAHRESFRTYCVVFNTKTEVYCALREAAWSFNLSSADPGRGSLGQPVSPITIGGDQAAQDDPAIGVSANDLNNDETLGGIIVSYTPLPGVKGSQTIKIQKAQLDKTRKIPE